MNEIIPKYVYRHEWHVGNILAFGFIALLGILLLWLFSDVLLAKSPVHVKTIEVEEPVIYPGNYLTVHWIVEKAEACPGTLTRYFVDSQRRITYLDLPVTPFLKVGTTDFNERIPLPNDMAPGLYKYGVTVNWRCYIFREVSETLGEVLFTVEEYD